VKNQHNVKIKIVHSDRGGEYYRRHTPYGQIPGPFVKFLEEDGIVTRYSLQDDVAVERRNHTLMDMVHNMLSNSTLPLSLWMEVLKTVAHIINCVPSKAAPTTPYEL
jgi:hypothetical protein